MNEDSIMLNLTPEQQTALNEFNEIRKVLRVPFPEDMRDLATPQIPKPEFPEGRRWKGRSLFYQVDGYKIASPTQAEKPKTEKKT
jgi:hypothetical protein